MRQEDVGELISWIDFRIWLENLPPTGESALYRARHPHDWWYDMPLRMQAWQLAAMQGANWQRGGGRGTRPKVFEPVYPKPERVAAKNVIPLDQIKARLAERQRRPTQ